MDAMLPTWQLILSADPADISRRNRGLLVQEDANARYPQSSSLLG